MSMRDARLVGVLSIACAVAWAGCGDDDGGSMTTPDSSIPIDMGTPRDMGTRDMGTPPEDMGTPRDMGMRDMGAPPEDMGPPPEDMGTGDAGGEACDESGVTEQIACGMCGAQTRFCTSELTWEYGPCEDEHGVCVPGTEGTIECAPGMEIDARCNDACAYEPVDPMARCELPTCDAPLALDGVAGSTVSIDYDTSAGAPGPLDLGPTCGGAPLPGEGPPQVVIALTIPGTGIHEVTFSLVNDQTDAELDTVVQVRTGACTDTPEDSELCFDDTRGDVTDFRSSGSFGAMGGSTVYLVVTGFAYGGDPPEGRTVAGHGHLEVTVGDEAHAPTLTTASVEVSEELSTIRVTGGDADGDALSVRVTLLDAMGMPVDRDDSGSVDALDDIDLEIAPPVTGMTSFTATALDGFFFQDDVANTMATRARIVIVDALGLVSAPVTADIVQVTVVGFGAMCDATHVCRMPFVCTAGTCQATPDIAAACMGATEIVLRGMTSMGTAGGMLDDSAGAFVPECGGSSGDDVIYRVTVPAGAWDLIASNQNDGTPAGTDTVIHIRRTCGDPMSEVACSDDAGEPRAEAVVEDAMPGEYTIFQDLFDPADAGTSVTYRLEVRLRPVIGAGAACDPMEIMNRCSTGPCLDSGLCPAS